MSCNKIAANILNNCYNLVSGIKDTAYLINIDDIDKDSCAFDANNGLLLTQLVLKTASPALTAFKIEGHNYSNEHDTALVKKKFYNAWDHNFRFRIFDNTPEDKLWITNATESRLVVIIENNYNKAASPAGRTVFEVLGWDHGLEVKECTRVAADEEMQGGWNLLAGCNDQVKESNPPLALFVGGSLTATEAAIAALL